MRRRLVSLARALMLTGSVLMWMGCEGGAGPPRAHPPLARDAVVFQSMGYGDGQGGIVSITGAPLTLDEIGRAQAHEARLSIDPMRALTAARGWRGETAAVERIVGEAQARDSALAPAAAQQLAATLALQSGEVLADTARPARAVVARYVSVLVDAGSPEAMVIERGLAALSSTWNRERIGEAARTTAAATRAALALREANASACPRCDAALKATAPDIHASLAAYRQAQRDAVDRLAALGAR